MEFHGIKMVGPFIPEKVTKFPADDNLDYEIASIVYHLGYNDLYIKTPTGWKTYSSNSSNSNTQIVTTSDLSIDPIGTENYIFVSDATPFSVGQYVYIYSNGYAASYMLTEVSVNNLRLKGILFYSSDIGQTLPSQSYVDALLNVPYALTMADFTIPLVGSELAISVTDTSSYAAGEYFYLYNEVGTAAYFKITAIKSKTLLNAILVHTSMAFNYTIVKFTCLYHYGFNGIIIQNVHPLGDLDGSNTIFQIPGNQSCLENSLTVFLNGLLYGPESIIISNDHKSFEIADDNIPTSDDCLTISYIAY